MLSVTGEYGGRLLNNYVWLSGTSDLTATSGAWLFYDGRVPSLAKSLLSVAWTRPSGASPLDRVATFVVTGAVSTDAHGLVEGDSVRYAHVTAGGQTEVTFDAFVAGLDNPLQAGRYLVAYDLNTTAGSVVYPDGTKKCWDADKNCVDCMMTAQKSARDDSPSPGGRTYYPMR